ncbi:hypothetical protein MLD38_028685 [Melastoma candidum]|uniref:Uncharacterized protein n=1 Tax=Melastoma candidum TaxID=119954 RepID=A0ACB9N7K3_9MYRT|nr:hypothetical protein MLD38_028685 [Melastoma candidum]
MQCYRSKSRPVAAAILQLLLLRRCLSLPRNMSVPALIVFGDSIVDPGNNNGIKTLVKCNFPPYGRDFAGGKPTGRFRYSPPFLYNHNMYQIILERAEKLGIKEYVPAYLDASLQLHDLLTGVSFASGVSGYDPLTPQIASVLSLSDQLELFKDYVTKIRSDVGIARAATIISDSLYLVCTGSDDIANTYFTTPFRRIHYGIPSYTDFLINSASTFFQELYGLGARRIGVIGLPPIGCVLSQKTLEGGIKRACSEHENEAAMLFNSKLSSLLNSLNSRLQGSTFVLLDIYSTLLSIISNPIQYGFEVSDKGCCGTGNIEASILCNRLDDASTCKDDTKYLFWDSYHPTEKAYQILTTKIYERYIHRFFQN